MLKICMHAGLDRSELRAEQKSELVRSESAPSIYIGSSSSKGPAIHATEREKKKEEAIGGRRETEGTRLNSSTLS